MAELLMVKQIFPRSFFKRAGKIAKFTLRVKWTEQYQTENRSIDQSSTHTITL